MVKTALIIVIGSLMLAGCGSQSEARNYYEHPIDAEVNQYAFERCMALIRGPNKTVYNDVDEAMDVCFNQARDIARYCPDRTEWACQPQYQRSQSDVRAILPRGA